MKLTQAVFNGIDPKFKWAFVGTNGDHVFSETVPRWSEVDGCFSIKAGDEICPVAHEVWVAPSRKALFDSAIQREGVPLLAPAEFQKLLIADARHNAARMVDDGRLTMDQFNEIFPE